MIDSKIFPEFSKQLIIQQNRVVLRNKNCSYLLQILFSDRKISKIHDKIQQPKQIFEIQAVYGIIPIQINQYLVVVTKASVVGQLFQQIVFRVQKLEFICLNEEEYDVDKQYIIGLKSVLDNQSLFYSFQYDLTNNLQQFVQAQFKLDAFREQYMYNKIWINKFIQIQADQWVTTFISGNVCFNFIQLSSTQSLQLILITRRDKRRQGLRYLTRGLDLDGNPANSCQTQMVLRFQDQLISQYFSYTQLRGSIPLRWKQTPDLSFNPKIKIEQNEELNYFLMNKHYKNLSKNYSRCTLINLVDKKGDQKIIGNYFNRVHSNLKVDQFELLWFDFHGECKNQKYQNLIKLIDLIQQKIESYGYFHLSHKPESKNNYCQVNKQKGIFRTNCVDCLDRTNVVQSIIAKKILVKWLTQLKIIKNSKRQQAFQKLNPQIEDAFQYMWIQNANSLSRLYAGTRAMKTDITKLGTRTYLGILNDAKIGVQRYFLSNFYDGRTQDYIHMSLNQLKPNQNQNHRIRHPKVKSLYPLCLLFILIPLTVVIGIDRIYNDQQQHALIKAVAVAISCISLFGLSRIFNSWIVRKPIFIN